MRIIRDVSADEVWCEWLKTEYKERLDRRFHETCEKLTTNPDYSRKEDNDQRKQLLISIRRPMVTGFPKETKWYLVELEAEDARARAYSGIGKNEFSVKFRKEVKLFARYLKGESRDWSPSHSITV